MVQRQAARTAASNRVFHGVYQNESNKLLHREPGLYYVNQVAQAGPDYTAVAIRAWRDESYLPMVEKPAVTETDQDSIRQRITDTQNASVKRPGKITRHYLSRHS